MVALVSRASLMSFVNLDPEDHRYDAVLKPLVEGVTDSIEEYLNRSLEWSEQVDYFPSDVVHSVTAGVGSIRYDLRRFPVSSEEPFDIRYSPSSEWDSSPSLSSPYSYILDPLKGSIRLLLRPSVTYVDNVLGYRATYVGGYDIKRDSFWNYLLVPAAISTAAAIQTSIIFTSLARGSLGLQTAGGDNPSSLKSTYTIATYELAPEVRMYLRPHIAGRPLAGRRR